MLLLPMPLPLRHTPPADADGAAARCHDMPPPRFDITVIWLALITLRLDDTDVVPRRRQAYVATAMPCLRLFTIFSLLRRCYMLLRAMLIFVAAMMPCHDAIRYDAAAAAMMLSCCRYIAAA